MIQSSRTNQEWMACAQNWKPSVGLQSFCTFKVLLRICEKNGGQIFLKFKKLSSILYSDSLASATNASSCPCSCHRDFPVGCHSFCMFKVLFKVYGKSEGQISLKFVKFSSILFSASLTSAPLPSAAAIATQCDKIWTSLNCCLAGDVSFTSSIHECDCWIRDWICS
jgi:hypothetical protein